MSDVSGVDPWAQYVARTRQIESGGNPNAVTGSNYGTFQFGPAEMRKYGITDWRDQGQQLSALSQESAENSVRFAKQFGRNPSSGELYLMHQQGAAGGPALMAADPGMPAWQAIRPYYSSDAIAKKAIMGNIPSGNPMSRAGVDGITAGMFRDLWLNRFNNQSQIAAWQTNPWQGHTQTGAGPSPYGMLASLSPGSLASTAVGGSPGSLGAIGQAMGIPDAAEMPHTGIGGQSPSNPMTDVGQNAGRLPAGMLAQAMQRDPTGMLRQQIMRYLTPPGPGGAELNL